MEYFEMDMLKLLEEKIGKLDDNKVLQIVQDCL